MIAYLPYVVPLNSCEKLPITYPHGMDSPEVYDYTIAMVLLVRFFLCSQYVNTDGSVHSVTLVRFRVW